MMPSNRKSDDFNDSLDDLLGAPAKAAPAAPVPASYSPPSFDERCPRCGGSGRYGNFGTCFKCNGSGKQSFKTSREDRTKARAGRTARKARTAAENVEAFKVAHPDVFAWMDGSDFPFAVSLLEAVGKYGALTENQLAAAHRSIEKLASAKAAAVARVTDAKPIEMSKIEAAFARAGTLLKKPRLSVAGISISPAKADSKNAGSLYVREQGMGGAYLGRITAGRFVCSRECTPEIEAQVLSTAADPQAAAVAYGRLTGRCAICSRTLSDPESVARGIGPICADKFGW